MLQDNRQRRAAQEDRRPLSLPAEFEVVDGHREQVRFSGSSTARSPQVTWGESLDISAAGMGLVCGQFVPRMTEGTVRIFAGEGAGSEVVFEQRGRVRRANMRAQKQGYVLGVAFVDPQPGLEGKVSELLRRSAEGAGSKAGRSKGGDRHG